MQLPLATFVGNHKPLIMTPTAPYHPVSRLPRDLYTAAQLRQLEKLAIERFAIPGIELMRRAGGTAFSALQERWPSARRLLVFAGGGNNGGDGYIIATLARQQKTDVTVVCIAEPTTLKGDAAIARDAAIKAGVPFVSAAEFFAQQADAITLKPGEAHNDIQQSAANTLIVDAMLGTGLDRPVSDSYAQAIAWINAASTPVLAVDIPSGLHADTGSVLGDAVRAHTTVSFIGIKQGLLTAAGRGHAGEIVFAGLDLPQEVCQHAGAPPPNAQRFDINHASAALHPRPRHTHKGDNGHAVIVGGDNGYGGAALLAAEAAARSGAGRVSLITRSAHRPAMLARRPEVMVLGTEDEAAASTNINALLQRADVLCIGPGLGQGDWGRILFSATLAVQQTRQVPLVCDADALALLAESFSDSAAARLQQNWILTPHPGEAAQLLDCSAAEVQADRFQSVQRLQQTYGGSCLLKGSGSLCYDGSGPVGLCSEGNPGMASGGMGDVLSGIVCGLLAQGLPPSAALHCAVAVHGEAADLAAAAAGERGLLAADLFAFLPQLLNPAQPAVTAS